jgi:hypothetical protein
LVLVAPAVAAKIATGTSAVASTRRTAACLRADAERSMISISILL